MKTKRICIEAFGGPEVLDWVDVDIAAPGPGDILVRHSAVGLNYIDVYHHTGLYPIDLPSGLGLEAAGVVEAVGSEVRDFKEGDRVGYCAPPLGAYSERRVIAAESVVKLPEGIDDETAAAILLKGATAEYLVRRTYPVKPGETVLFHAAAGGVGLIACQWLANIGATVIGTAGSAEKRALAKAHGCDHAIDYGEEDWPQQVVDLTDGKGVHVVYDGVGKATFEGSLKALRRRGMLVSFGNASGPVEGVGLGILSQHGSLYVTRPTLFDYYATREELVDGTDALFEMVSRGKIEVEIGQRYPLKDAAQAHRDLEARKTTGSTLLIP